MIVSSGHMLKMDKDMYLVEGCVKLNKKEYAVLYKIPKQQDDIEKILNPDKLLVSVIVEDGVIYTQKIEDEEICKKVYRKRILQESKEKANEIKKSVTKL